MDKRNRDCSSIAIEAFDAKFPQGDILSEKEKKLLVMNKGNHKKNEACCRELSIADTCNDFSNFDIDVDFILRRKVRFSPSCEIILFESESCDIQGSPDKHSDSKNGQSRKTEFSKEKTASDTENNLSNIKLEVLKSSEKGNETSNEDAGKIQDSSSCLEKDSNFVFTKENRDVLSNSFITLDNEIVNIIQSSTDGPSDSENLDIRATELQNCGNGCRTEKELSIISESVSESFSTENEAYNLDSSVAKTQWNSSDLENDVNLITGKPKEDQLKVSSFSGDILFNAMLTLASGLLCPENTENCKEFVAKHSALNVENYKSSKMEKKTCNVEPSASEIRDNTSDSNKDMDFVLTKMKNIVKLSPDSEIMHFDYLSHYVQSFSDRLSNCENMEYFKNRLIGHDSGSEIEKKLSTINEVNLRSPIMEKDTLKVEASAVETPNDSLNLKKDLDFIKTKKKKIKKVKFALSSEIIPIENERIDIPNSPKKNSNFDSRVNNKVETPVSDIMSQMHSESSKIGEEILKNSKIGNEVWSETAAVYKILNDSSDLEKDLDFILTKKKKAKSVPFSETASVEKNIVDTLNPSDELGDTMNDYSYDYLLTRAFSMMREKNPNLDEEVKKKLVMKPPQVIRSGAKKTSFVNFLEICKLLHRVPYHLQSFLLVELGTNGSVDGHNQLIIKGRFQQKQIENVLRRYIREYVTCHTCHSPNTLLEKDIRLCFLQCETCGSRCSVASIKSGFQAVIHKRAAMRAKAV